MARSTVTTLRWVAPGLAAGMLVGALGVAWAKRPEIGLEIASRVVAPAALHAAHALPLDLDPPPEAPSRCPAEPVLEVRAPNVPPPVELAKLIREHPEQLGSASIGSPTRGSLWNGAELVTSEGIERKGDHAWGTEIAVRSIERAVREVRRCFPGTPKLFVGDISRKEGGWLLPHRSHQSGLDADIGYYYSTGAAWFEQATAKNLDAPRTWALVRALIDGGTVEIVFIDRSIQPLLRAYARTLEEDKGRVDLLFRSDDHPDAVIRHASGHTAHFHVRFRDPAAVALGQHMAGFLPGRLAAIGAQRASPTQPRKPGR